MIFSIHNISVFWLVWSILFISFFLFIMQLVYKRKKYHSQPTEFIPPENINPLLAGYLIDGQFNIRDYIAGFIYLIQQKVINIDKQKPKKAIFKGVDLDYAQVHIEEIAFQEGYVEKGLSPVKSTLIYGSLFALLTLGFIFYIKEITIGSRNLIFLNDSYIYLMSLAISIYLAYKIVGLSKMKLTEKGEKAKNALVGFKKFLLVAEADRLDYFNSPKSNPENFMEYLPYAIALGVDENWNYKYAGLLANVPSWYSPTLTVLPFLPEAMDSITDLIDLVQEHHMNKNKNN